MVATIKDVARLANTSISTVSKVMNQTGSMSEETILKVKNAADKLNYKPNVRARSLALQTSSTIVFVTQLEKNLAFNNPYIFELICGLEKILSNENYTLALKSLTEKEACKYIQNSIETKMAGGFIINGTLLSKEMDKLLSRQLISHIVIGNPGFKNSMSWIDINNRLAGKVAAEHLLACGYKKIAFIGKRVDDGISMERLCGVAEVIPDNRIILPKKVYRSWSTEKEEECGYMMTQEVLESDNIPDAFVCSNNYNTFGCINALRETKLRIGVDVGIIAFDDFPFTSVLDPPITSVAIDMYDLGMQAGKLILQKILQPRLNIQSCITQPKIIQRMSTRQVRKSSVKESF